MDTEFFTSNRTALQRSLPTGMIVLTAYADMQRGNDASHPYEQEANFWYVTGINKPGWRLVIDCAAELSWLIAPDVSDVHALFDGAMSHQQAREISGVDTVVSSSEGERLIQDMVKTHTPVYAIGDHPHQDHFDFTINPAGPALWTWLSSIATDITDCRAAIAILRAIKQPVEIAAIQRAIDSTIHAFNVVKQKLPNVAYEYEIEAEFSYAFRRSGALGHAYDPIVAAGKNACTLHYSDNQSAITAPALVLMDVGARVDGYAADITRTYAVGAITDRQRQVHAAVEHAHHRIIDILRPGLSVVDYHDQVDDIMKSALISLGLMSSDSDTEAYRRYFPHAISHGLGVDVHDSLGGPSELQPGMVLTVEPGIYIPEESIGVRIEDDILITDTGNRNMSAALPTGV